LYRLWVEDVNCDGKNRGAEEQKGRGAEGKGQRRLSTPAPLSPLLTSIKAKLQRRYARIEVEMIQGWSYGIVCVL
jgi:hypothetical protein